MTRERGTSLAEVLVAMTVLALAMSIALVLYNGATRSFKVGDNLAEQQQLVRIAFDLLLHDLRLAGLNHNPDGSKNRPDEQIELADGNAIVFRSDFDGEDPIESLDPETDLTTNGAFQVVSTGNDEIRGYVLAKSDGTSTDTLSFDADVMPSPRDGKVETVTMYNVSLSQDDPPYTLYRFHVLPESLAVQREPVVDNVRSLRFRYYDAAGLELVPVDGTDGPDKANVHERAAIRRIGVGIVGLTAHPDPRFTDDDDSNPVTRDHHKFRLVGDVTPRNLGSFGLKDLEAVASPPSEPPRPILYPGHCKGFWMEWAPNPPQDEVARYDIRHGTNPLSLTGLAYAFDPVFYLDGLEHDTEYWVSIQAVDDSGNPSELSEPANEVTTNDNTPEAPTDLVLVEGYGSIRLDWVGVTENTTSDPSVDPASPAIRDLLEYRVYRSRYPDFPPDETDLVGTVSALVPMDPYTFLDTTVPNCTQHYYRVTAADGCGTESDPTESVYGSSTYDIAPAVPLNVQAYDESPGTYLRWDPVQEDAAGNPLVVTQYEVWRTEPMPKEDDPVVPDDFTLHWPITDGSVDYFDPVSAPGLDVHKYAVLAFGDCPFPADRSPLSAPATPECSFNGYVSIESPDFNEVISGDQSVYVVVANPGGSYSLQLIYEHVATGLQVVHDAVGSGPTWGRIWQTGNAVYPAGSYWVHAIVTDPGGCAQKTSVRAEVEK